MRAKDAAGNVDPNPPSVTWTIDTTPPDTVIDTSPLPLSASTSASFTFHSTKAGSRFTCQLDAQPAQACNSGSVTYAGLAQGSHTFTVAATDLAGNTDKTPASFTWTVDSIVPDTVIDSAPSDPTLSATAMFTFHGTDPIGDTFLCSLDGAATAPCASPMTYTGLSQTTYTFSVAARGATGLVDPSPATFTWTVGAVTADAFDVDEDFNRFDSFDFVLGNGTGSSLKIKSTNPSTFRHRILIANNTGTAIDPAHGNTATTILTVPATPTGSGACGFVNCSTFAGASPDPAFALRAHKTAHIWPGGGDDDGDADDLPITIQYMTLAQYQANGNSCDVKPTAAYSSTLPADGAAKCVKITGFTIPVTHKARVRINFESRLKGTDGWDPNSKDRLFMGFLFESKTTVTFGSTSQLATTADGIIGAGSKMSAVGGFVLNGAGTPQSGLTVRLFNQVSQVSCAANAPNVVAQDVSDANGFYFIYRAGIQQNNWATPNLPSGVQYAVQLCNAGVQAAPVQTLDHRLGGQEFEEIDFDLP